MFLRTLEQYPERGRKIKYLVIGLGDCQENSNDEEGLAEDSQDLVRAITLCPNLRHLQVRPLHHTARDALLSALAPLELESLVCAPRVGVCEQDWSTGLYSSTDIGLARPSMKVFELEFGVGGQEHDLSPQLASQPPIFLPLVQIRLHCDLSDETLCALLAALQHLQVCDLYFEKMLQTDQ